MKDPLITGDCSGSLDEWGGDRERWADEDGQRITYVDWLPERTRVVSGPIGNNGFPGRSFRSVAAARQYWSGRARIVDAHWIQGRWCFRITLPVSEGVSCGAA